MVGSGSLSRGVFSSPWAIGKAGMRSKAHSIIVMEAAQKLSLFILLNYLRVFTLRLLPRENFYSLFSELPFIWPPVPGDADAACTAGDLLAFSELSRAGLLCHEETVTLQDVLAWVSRGNFLYIPPNPFHCNHLGKDIQEHGNFVCHNGQFIFLMTTFKMWQETDELNSVLREYRKTSKILSCVMEQNS